MPAFGPPFLKLFTWRAHQLLKFLDFDSHVLTSCVQIQDEQFARQRLLPQDWQKELEKTEKMQQAEPFQQAGRVAVTCMAQARHFAESRRPPFLKHFSFKKKVRRARRMENARRNRG